MKNIRKLSQEFLESAKKYYDLKSKVFSKYNILDTEAFKEAQIKILEAGNIDELCLLRRKIQKIGMNSAKNLTVIEDFYHYLIENAKNLHISELKFLKENQVIDFLYQKSLTNKSSSIALYKIILGEFFRFLDKKMGYDFDFTLRNLRFNKEKPLPKFLPKPKFLNFIDYLQNAKFNRDFDKKNRLILLIIALTGMRSNEVRSLKLSDLQVTFNEYGESYYSIKITGKGNKQRIAGIKKSLIEKHLQEWLKCDLKKRKYNQDYLFLNPAFKGSDTTINFLIKTLKKLRILKEKESAGLHILRHSFASFIYEQTKDIVLTQNLLGHSSIETTKIYVHRTTDFSKQILNLF
ncbi:tyrosine-type recombinase/integrase [Helicobacter sp. 11S03491-1]|uniref:tyrosine-type recombinase/integrase n=1 Tax=Helicobacter sp. 11S03491-1 TaxID=1476196 RepID=UPI000BA6A4C7|nr:tyrosine-type recombinase/integrase [Helicobacter sp. 11S03491-1]PAF41068.1 hypothetical protein BKH45_08470 [Helicobacter sp. 11S03491-1]